MKEDKRKANLKEWLELKKSHPSFAKAFLAQQAILMEASEIGLPLIDRSMCMLLQSGLPVLFEDYWTKKCRGEIRDVHIGGVIGCLTYGNRDPARCFDLSDEGDWFDDPLKGGKVVPPKPPIPPL